MKNRKKYTPEFKAEIVIEILKEQKTIVQIASHYGVHPNQLGRWKTEFLKEASSAFKNGDKSANVLKVKLEKHIEVLYGEIGRLTTQVNWLKKKSGISLE